MGRGVSQSAYQIQVASTKERLLNDIGDIWDSGEVESTESVNVPFDGRPLETYVVNIIGGFDGGTN